MKLLFCDNSLREFLNFRGDVISHFRNKRIKIVLVAPKNIDTSLLNPLDTVYFSRIRRSSMNPIHDIIYFIDLIKIYKREKPDVIFHYTIKPNIYGSLAARICGINSIAMITGLGYAFNHKGIKTKIARALYKYAMRYPQKILVLNQENLNILINHHIIDPDKVILLSGGEGINLDIYQ